MKSGVFSGIAQRISEKRNRAMVRVIEDHGLEARFELSLDLWFG